MVRLLAALSTFLVVSTLAVALWAAEAFWIDVRTPEEFRAGHIAGAVNIPYEQIAERIGEVTADKDAPVYLYCRSGRRSDIALQALREAGYRNAVNLGGLEDIRDRATVKPVP